MEHKQYTQGSQIKIFDQTVALRKPLKQSGHERAYTRLIEVDELHVDSAMGLSKTELNKVVSALLSHSPDTNKITGAVQVFVYTVQENGSPAAVPLAKTHAFSILTSRGQRLRHHYYEKSAPSAFKKVSSLSLPLAGPLDLDDIRLLHFANASQHGLPSKSTIYQFNSGTWGKREWKWEKNLSLRIATLRDSGRNWGAPTLGLYGDAVYRAITGEGGTFCGGNRDCPEGSDDTCGPPPGGPDWVCGALPPNGDIFVDWVRAFRDQEIDPPTALDFDLYKSLRKKFLAHDQKGREAVSLYYIAALFLKYDREQVKLYAQAVPYINQAWRAFLSAADETVIATSSLRGAILEIIKNHRDIRNREFQRVLDIVEENLRYGM